MNTTYPDTVDVALNSDYRRSEYQPTPTEPLESLTQDVSRLANCLNDYQRQLADSMTESENPRAFAGIRISITTLALFGIVALFAIALNLTLRSASANGSHILQANVAMGVLYLCVAVSAFNDLARGRSRWRTEREALQLRTQSIAQQFEELSATRQAWVQELTRSQWTSETEKLKLQLVQQELAAKEVELEQCNSALADSQKQLDALKQRSASIQAEVAVTSERLSRAQQDASDSRSQKEKLDQECAQLREESKRLQKSAESQSIAFNDSAARLQKQSAEIERT